MAEKESSRRKTDLWKQLPLAFSPNRPGAQFHSVLFQTRATFLLLHSWLLTPSLALTAARAAEQHPAAPKPGTRAGSAAGGAGAARAARSTTPHRTGGGTPSRPVREERPRSPAPRGGAAAGLRVSGGGGGAGARGGAGRVPEEGCVRVAAAAPPLERGVRRPREPAALRARTSAPGASELLSDLGGFADSSQ